MRPPCRSAAPRPAAACRASRGASATASTLTILWDLDNVRPPPRVEPAALLARLASAAGAGAGGGAAPPTLALFANPVTLSSLPLCWAGPHLPPGTTLTPVPLTRGAADQAITAAAVAFVRRWEAAQASTTSAPTRTSLALISTDAAAFTGLLRWAGAAGVRTVAIGPFAGAKPERPDAWRKRPLPSAAHTAVLWSEVVVGGMEGD